MRLSNGIRSYIVWRVTKFVLRHNAPSTISLSGQKSDSNNCYIPIFVDDNGTDRFVAEEISAQGVTGKWSDNGESYVNPCSIPYNKLCEYDIHIEHYYRRWIIKSDGIVVFLINTLFFYPQIIYIRDKVSQKRFNEHQLMRKDKISVLSMIFENTIRKDDYIATATELLTTLHSRRWVRHPDKNQMMSYYRLLFRALEESGDLERCADGYSLKPKALNTIDEFEKEERRHRQIRSTQRGIFWLTVVLSGVGVAQVLFPDKDLSEWLYNTVMYLYGTPW